MSESNLVFAIPGDLNTPTGGYSYDKTLSEHLPHHGHLVTHLQLGDSFPHPTPEDTQHAAKRLRAVPGTSVLLIDGLALGALDPAVLGSVKAPIVGLIHHPLAYEGDLDEVRREELLRREQVNLSRCAEVIVTSPSTATLLHDTYGVPRRRITIAPPGTQRPTLSPTPLDPPLIVSVGSLVPRKGHDVLIRALAGLTDLPWQAVVAGLDRDVAYADWLRELMTSHGLDDRLRLVGSVPTTELNSLYSQASIFALATRFEGYGMVFGEAMAAGLPIVTCATGAVPDTVAPGAGLLVPVDDHRAFGEAIRTLLTDNSLRTTMAAASHQAGEALPTWSDTAQIVADVLNRTRAGTIN